MANGGEEFWVGKVGDDSTCLIVIARKAQEGACLIGGGEVPMHVILCALKGVRPSCAGFREQKHGNGLCGEDLLNGFVMRLVFRSLGMQGEWH